MINLKVVFYKSIFFDKYLLCYTTFWGDEMKRFCYVFILIMLVCMSVPTLEIKADETATLYGITDDNNIRGTIQSYGEVHHYYFVPQTTGYMILYVEKGNQLDVQVSNEQRLAHPETITESRDELFVVEGDRYDVTVKGNVGDYSIKAILPRTQTNWNNAYEPNDTIPMSYPIENRKEITSYIENGEDRDYYRFEVTKSGQIMATLDDYPNNFRMELFDWQGNSISSQDYTPNGKNITYWAKPGTYYIMVRSSPGRGSETNPYKLKVTFPTEENLLQDNAGEPNDVFQDAFPLQPEKDYSFAFEDKKDVDWYKVVLNQPGKIILFGNKNSQNFTMSWFNEQHQSLGYSEIQHPKWTDRYIHDTGPANLPAGTYYVRVTRDIQTNEREEYSLRLTIVGPDDASEDIITPNELEIGNEVHDRIDYIDDVDLYRLNGGNVGILQIKLHANFDAVLTLRDKYFHIVQPSIRQEGDDLIYSYYSNDSTYNLLIKSDNDSYGPSMTYSLSTKLLPLYTVNDIKSTDKVITGTTLPNQPILILANPQLELGSGQADNKGNFSIPVTTLEDSENIFLCFAKSIWDYYTPYQIPVKVVTKPTIHMVDDYGDQDSTIRGIGKPNSTVEVRKNGILLGKGIVLENGMFSISIPNQPPGTQLTLKATDHFGNVSNPISIIVKEKIPLIIQQVDKIADYSTLITGKSKPNSTVIVKKNNVIIGKSIVDGNGNFHINIPKQQSGTILGLTATDKFGRLSPPIYRTVMDLTPPKKPTVSPVTTRSTVIKGTGEQYTTVIITKGSKELKRGTVTKKGTFAVNIPNQKNGTVLTVRLKDAGGNLSAPLVITVKK